MRISAYLLNVPRAHIVNKVALYSVLLDTRIAGAAFDVFWEEPANPNDKLLKLNNFILTPHIAGWTADSVDAIARIIATNIERFAKGEIPLTVVNPELTY
jgi:D-3-phosphoglycerate dehydrogenase